MSSEKSQLLREVRILAEELQRPISSRDLTRRWQEFPDNRPLLLQAPGQLLIKASREFEGCERISRVGIFGNLAFYAPDKAPRWRHSFTLHTIRERMRQHLRWGIPGQALYLVGTPHEKYALNALAGFIREWDTPLLDDGIRQIATDTGFIKLLALAKSEVGPPWAGRLPKLSSRAEASKIILSAIAETRDGDSSHFNMNRPLATVAWPMTPLFAKTGYWIDQVRAYSASKWPSEDADPFEARAMYLSMTYGAV